MTSLSRRWDATPLHADGRQWGFTGLGVLSTEIADDSATGVAGFGFDSLEPEDVGAELQFEVQLPHPAGFVPEEDTGFVYEGTGTTFQFRKKRNGVVIGTWATATITEDGVVLVSAEFSGAYEIAAFVAAEFSGSYTILGGDIVLTPSAARTVNVQATDRAFTVAAPGFWNMANAKKPKGIKDANSTTDISFNWSAWLTDCADTIAEVEFEVTGGLTKVQTVPVDGLCTVVVSGGTAGTALVTCRITTNSSPPRVEDRTVELTIEER